MAWNTLTSRPSGGDEAAFSHDGTRLYALGGITGGTRSTQISRYDPSTDAWIGDGNMGAAHGDQPGGFYLATPNRAYCAGGSNAAGTAQSRVDAKDITPDTAVQVGSMGTARELVTASAAGGLGYVFGGRNAAGTPLSSAEKYDPSTNLWSGIAAMPAARRFLGRGMLTDPEGRFHLIGGDDGTTIQSTHWRYDPSTDAYTVLAPLPLNRRRGGVVFHADDGFLYYIGGDSTAGNNAEVFRYDRAADAWTQLDAAENQPTTGTTAALTLGDRIYTLQGSNLYEFFPPALRPPWQIGVVGWRS